MAYNAQFDLRGKRIQDTYQQVFQYDTSSNTAFGGQGSSIDNFSSSFSTTASFAATAAFARNATSASYAPPQPTVSASYAPVEPDYSASVSSAKQNALVAGNTYAITSSWAGNTVSASYATRTSQSNHVVISDIGNTPAEHAVVFQSLTQINTLVTNGGGSSLFSFNPGTNTLKAGTFLGNLSGSVSSSLIHFSALTSSAMASSSMIGYDINENNGADYVVVVNGVVRQRIGDDGITNINDMEGSSFINETGDGTINFYSGASISSSGVITAPLLIGTASYANQALSASWAPDVTMTVDSASWASSSISSSYADKAQTAASVQGEVNTTLTITSVGSGQTQIIGNGITETSYGHYSLTTNGTIDLSSSFQSIELAAPTSVNITSSGVFIAPNDPTSQETHLYMWSWEGGTFQTMSTNDVGFVMSNLGVSNLTVGSAITAQGNIRSTFGSISASAGFHGNIDGTASYANQALSASWSPGDGSGTLLTTGSTYDITASWAVNVVNGANQVSVSWASSSLTTSYVKAPGPSIFINDVDNPTGFYNTALGAFALSSSILNEGTAGENTAIGGYALGNLKVGDGNTAVGDYAVAEITASELSTAVGAYIVIGDGLTNVTVIGAEAAGVQSNTLILGNSASVGIGTSEPQSRLHVMGEISASTLRIPDTADGSGITVGGIDIQTNDVTNGSIGWNALSIDGGTSWVKKQTGPSVLLHTSAPDFYIQTSRSDVSGSPAVTATQVRVNGLDNTVAIGGAIGTGFSYGSPIMLISGSNRITISGSISASLGFTGSLNGTASNAVSASWAPFTQTEQTSGSWASASFAATSASWASASISSSYSVTASYAANATGTVLVTGSVYDITASWAINVVNGGGGNTSTQSSYDISMKDMQFPFTAAFAGITPALLAGSSFDNNVPSRIGNGSVNGLVFWYLQFRNENIAGGNEAANGITASLGFHQMRVPVNYNPAGGLTHSFQYFAMGTADSVYTPIEGEIPGANDRVYWNVDLYSLTSSTSAAANFFSAPILVGRHIVTESFSGAIHESGSMETVTSVFSGSSLTNDCMFFINVKRLNLDSASIYDPGTPVGDRTDYTGSVAMVSSRVSFNTM